jgi:ubiquinone/menaquinone biosynthesis C-methylase UbiE
MATLKDVKDFWNRNLCLDSYLQSEYLSKEYFEEGAKLRYKYHYHIPRDIEILSKLKPNGKALEIGLGMGCDTQLLCEKGFDVTGVDLTPKSVEATTARLKFYNLKADVRTGNAEALDFDDGTFDVVYSFGVLHHTPDTQKAINEVHRVLKSDGIALIMLYNKNSLNYWAHLITGTQYDGTKKDPCPVERAYTKSEIRKLCSRYSKVDIRVDYLFGTGWKKVNYVMPLFAKKALGKLIGWHSMIWALK